MLCAVKSPIERTHSRNQKIEYTIKKKPQKNHLPRKRNPVTVSFSFIQKDKLYFPSVHLSLVIVSVTLITLDPITITKRKNNNNYIIRWHFPFVPNNFLSTLFRQLAHPSSILDYKIKFKSNVLTQ